MPGSAAADTARWTTTGPLDPGATITLVADRGADEVLAAFGGGDDRIGAPVPLSSTLENLDPHLCLTGLGSHVLAVEMNGWQGSRPAVLGAVAEHTRAASVYWSANHSETLNLAERGRYLGGVELCVDQVADDSEFGRLLRGVDRTDYARLREHALAAAARFTGVSVTPDALAALLAADVAYPLLPLPAEYYESISSWSAVVRPLADAAAWVPADRLRAASWELVGRAAGTAGTVDPDVAASIAGRAPNAAAIRRARLAELERFRGDGRIWRVLYAAGNPDPRSALIRAAEEAEFLLPPPAHRELIAATIAGLGGPAAGAPAANPGETG